MATISEDSEANADCGTRLAAIRHRFINNQTLAKGRVQLGTAAPSSTFITCKLANPLIDTLLSRLTPTGCESIYFSETKDEGRKRLESSMQTRKAWSQNLANLKNECSTITLEDVQDVDLPRKPKRNSTKAAGIANRKGILKRKHVSRSSPNHDSTSVRRQQTRSRPHKKSVSIPVNTPTVYHYPHQTHDSDCELDIVGSGATQTIPGGQEEDLTRGKEERKMAQAHRPSLKLKLSTNNFNVQTPGSESQTPNPQSAIRTPSIKLNFGKKPSISTASTPATKKETPSTTPASTKKRKRAKGDDGSEDELAKLPPPQRRLTLKTSVASAKTPATPGPVFRLKTKGKIPKRPLGVGYDSELEDREMDPVILEGFVLRMPPGPDCDYVNTAIRDGTIGVHRAQGGADIRIRCLDTNGRRGVMWVNGHQYATTVVDLPCIIEGMKSWDKKGWIKSIDICQMMLVLGTCATDDEAKNYPLPSDVDPKTYAYAHGLTAPMKWVRKRRFARTRRARVDDIESIERKVNALLEADAKALASTFQVFDHDPRIEQDQYSEVEDDYDDEDAEADEDTDYFGQQGGLVVETPGGMEIEAHVDQDQIDDIEAMFNEDEDDNIAPAVNGHITSKHVSATLLAPSARDSSVAVTSASASPSASAAVTAAPTPAEDASDDDEDDDDDASDRSDSEKDADDNLQQVKDRIADMESKIREQTELLKKTTNAIVKKKLARKIGELSDDVRMMKVQNGLAADGDGEDGDD